MIDRIMVNLARNIIINVIWIECDSTLVIAFYKFVGLIPWKFRNGVIVLQ